MEAAQSLSRFIVGFTEAVPSVGIDEATIDLTEAIDVLSRKISRLVNTEKTNVSVSVTEIFERLVVTTELIIKTGPEAAVVESAMEVMRSLIVELNSKADQLEAEEAEDATDVEETE